MMVNRNPERTISNGIALLIYLLGCIVAACVIVQFGPVDASHIGFADMAIMGFASFRLLHLISYDKVLDFLRDPLTRGVSSRPNWRRPIAEMLECIWCSGMWAALVIVIMYFLGG